MAVFDQVINITIASVRRWNFSGTLKKITVIRDVNGCISLFLETDASPNDTEIADLKSILRSVLGRHFRDKIYCDKSQNNDLIRHMISEIIRLRWDYEAADGVEWYILERAIAKKAWVECNRTQQAVWPYNDIRSGGLPKVVTFYSFKGGMGRTTALAATALALAQDGNNILLIDTDIEAPGLATLFFDENRIYSGLVDYLLEAAVTPSNELIDMSDIIQQVDDPVLMDGMEGRIFVIPAGIVDQGYLQKLARIDFQDTLPGNMKKQLSRLMKEAVKVIQAVCRVDYVLLDARAGFHDMGGIITTQMPHGAVLFGKDSRQSWQGLELVLKSISMTQEEKPPVAIVDSSCGLNGLVSAKEKEAFKNQAYTSCCEAYYAEDEEQPGPDAVDEAHSPIFIPYQPLLINDIRLFTDGTEAAGDNIRQLKGLLTNENYQQIKKRIQQWFGDEGERINGQASDS